MGKIDKNLDKLFAFIELSFRVQAGCHLEESIFQIGPYSCRIWPICEQESEPVLTVAVKTISQVNYNELKKSSPNASMTSTVTKKSININEIVDVHDLSVNF